MSFLLYAAVRKLINHSFCYFSLPVQYLFQLEEEEEEEQEDKFDIFVSVKDPEKIGEALL